jgi:RNA polymerase sigma-70 factor (ECF subfamily)
MSFAEQLAQGRTGDAAALENLFARWRALLRLQARRVLGAELSARVDPSDVVQEALTQAFQTLDQFRGQTEGEWVAWLRSMVIGQAARTLRRHRADRRDVTCDRPLPAAGTVDAAAGPVRRTLDREQAARLATAIEALPEPLREVVLRRVFHQEPFDTVAQALNRTAGAVRVIWTRALRQLREALRTD